MFRTSTRSRSVQGAQGRPSTNSCKRNSKPKPKISAPRRMVVRAISIGGRTLLPHAVGDQREGDAGEKQKERRGQRAAQLRKLQELRVARRAAEP